MRLSVTRLKTFRSCQAQWYMQDILGYEVPTSPSLALGTDVHAILEEYIQGNIDAEEISKKAQEEKDKPYTIAHRGLLHLDSALPKEGIERHVEEWIRAEVDGTPFTGKIDLWWVDEDGVLHILDHKTTSDARKWALSSEDAYHDLQLCVYAWLKAMDLPDVKKAQGHLIYYPTRKGVALRVDTPPWSYKKLKGAWESAQATAREMIEVGHDKKAPTYNLLSCNNYGGCPFQEECKRFREEGRFINQAERPTQQGAEPMLQHAIEALKPFPNPTREQIEEAASRARVDVEEVIGALGQDELSPQTKHALNNKVGRIKAWMKKTGLAVQNKDLVRAAADVGVPVDVLVEAVGLWQPWLPEKDSWVEISLKPEEAPQQTKEEVLSVPQEEAPEEAPEETPQQAKGVLSTPEDTHSVSEAPAVEVPPEALTILYINCMPVSIVPGIELTYLYDVLQPYFDKAAERAGVSDVSLADYGKGWIEAAAYLKKDLMLGKLPWKQGSWLFVEKDTPWFKYFSQFLTKHMLFVRGL